MAIRELSGPDRVDVADNLLVHTELKRQLGMQDFLLLYVHQYESKVVILTVLSLQ